MAKDTGYKVVIHMMPNLPNVGIERDMEQFIELFENPEFRPDGLKIYPTLVIRGTGLYELWRTGRYKSYSPEVLLLQHHSCIDFLSYFCKIMLLFMSFVKVQIISKSLISLISEIFKDFGGFDGSNSGFDPSVDSCLSCTT